MLIKPHFVTDIFDQQTKDLIVPISSCTGEVKRGLFGQPGDVIWKTNKEKNNLILWAFCTLKTTSKPYLWLPLLLLF